MLVCIRLLEKMCENALFGCLVFFFRPFLNPYLNWHIGSVCARIAHSLRKRTHWFSYRTIEMCKYDVDVDSCKCTTKFLLEHSFFMMLIACASEWERENGRNIFHRIFVVGAILVLRLWSVNVIAPCSKACIYTQLVHVRFWVSALQTKRSLCSLYKYVRFNKYEHTKMTGYNVCASVCCSMRRRWNISAAMVRVSRARSVFIWFYHIPYSCNS